MELPGMRLHRHLNVWSLVRASGLNKWSIEILDFGTRVVASTFCFKNPVLSPPLTELTVLAPQCYSANF